MLVNGRLLFSGSVYLYKAVYILSESSSTQVPHLADQPFLYHSEIGRTLCRALRRTLGELYLDLFCWKQLLILHVGTLRYQFLVVLDVGFVWAFFMFQWSITYQAALPKHLAQVTSKLVWLSQGYRTEWGILLWKKPSSRAISGYRKWETFPLGRS